MAPTTFYAKASRLRARRQEVSKKLAHPSHPVYDDGKGGGVQWWVKRCKSNRVCTQVARMGADADTLEEFWMKYGHPELLDRESSFRFFLD